MQGDQLDLLGTLDLALDKGGNVRDEGLDGDDEDEDDSY